MDALERRRKILEELSQTGTPLSASALARQLGVSRQIIVGDVALLRAGGEAVIATPRGYLLQREESGFTRRIACRHTAEEMESELTIIVDNGCTVEDVLVEHPVYGQLTGTLHLKSRYDVGQFIQRSRGAAPLSLLTDGIHIHTLHCPDEASYQRVKEMLDVHGFLIK